VCVCVCVCVFVCVCVRARATTVKIRAIMNEGTLAVSLGEFACVMNNQEHDCGESDRAGDRVCSVTSDRAGETAKCLQSPSNRPRRHDGDRHGITTARNPRNRASQVTPAVRAKEKEKKQARKLGFGALQSCQSQSKRGTATCAKVGTSECARG
jgi:hypothetical protein